MIEPLHTPGPWTVHQLSSGITWVRAGPDTDICSVFTDDGTIQNGNARLIAAAPDLLAALKWCQARLFIHEGQSDTYLAASAAISKALDL